MSQITPIIDNYPPPSYNDYNYSQSYEQLNKTFEEFKTIVIIFGSAISIVLYFLLYFSIYQYCKKQNKLTNGIAIELKNVENPEEEKAVHT